MNFPMKFVKWLLVIIAVLLGLFVLVTAFLPKDYHLERTVAIDAPADRIYDQFADLRAWQDWNPWNELDPEMEITFGETVAGKGAWYSWKSEAAGNGKMTILEADPPNRVRFELIFEGYEDLPSYSTVYLNPEEGDDTVQVTWTFEGTVGDQFFGRWMAVLVDTFVGKQYEQGLENLKRICEEGKPAMETAA